MGPQETQMRQDAIARRARFGLAPKQPIVDRALIPMSRPISKVDAETARAILADEFIRNWPTVPQAGPATFQWHCSLPTGIRRVPVNKVVAGENEPLSAPTMPEIVALLSKEFEVSAAEIKGPCRRARVMLPRQIAMYLGFRAGLSTGRVGQYLGNRDHTTALNGRLRISAKIKLDPEFAATVTRLEAQLTQ